MATEHQARSEARLPCVVAHWLAQSRDARDGLCTAMDGRGAENRLVCLTEMLGANAVTRRPTGLSAGKGHEVA